MRLSQLDSTLTSFIQAHRDNRLKKRFATLVTGGAGIGKTTLIKKIGTDLDMAVVIVHVAQLEPADLLGIPRSVEVKKGLNIQRYDLPGYLPHYLYNDNGEVTIKTFDDGLARKQIDVRLLGSKVKNKKELEKKHGEAWADYVKGVVIFLDEINRAVGDDTKQAIFELPGDYALHEYEVPENCIIVAAANPSTRDYQVNDMDTDKAWKDRFVELIAEAHVEDSLLYFKQQGFDESIISFILADEQALMEKEEFFEITTKRTPRSYEVLDNILKYVDLPEDDTILREICTGILGVEYGSTFVTHLKQALDKVPSAYTIVTAYDTVRSLVLDAISTNNMAYINRLVRKMYLFFATENEVLTLLYEQEDDQNSTLNPKHMEHIVQFLTDLPTEIRTSLIQRAIEFEWANAALGTDDSIYTTFVQAQNEAHQED